MPYANLRSTALDNIRPRVPEWVPGVQGIQGDGTAQMHVKLVARRLLQMCSQAELEACAAEEPRFPDWMPEEARKRWAEPPQPAGEDEAVEAASSLAPLGAEPPWAGKKPWQLRKHGFEEYVKENRARYQAPTVRWATIRERLSQDWQGESAGEKQRFIDIWKSKQTIFVQATDTPEKVAKPRLSQRQLAEIGTNFLAAAKEATRPEKSNGVTEAQARVQNLVLAAGMSSTDSKVRKEVAQSANLSKRQKIALREQGVAFSAVPRQAARRTCKMTDEELGELLAKHASVCSQYSGRMERQALKLDCSVQTAWSDDPCLNEVYALRTLQRKCRHGRLGFVKGSVFTDGCPLCCTWDAAVEKRIMAEINKVRTELLKFDADFYKDFKEVQLANGFDDKDFPESEVWLRLWFDHTQEKFLTYETIDDLQTLAELKLLVDGAGEFFDKGSDGGSVYQLVAEFNLHFNLRVLLWQQLMEWYYHPKPGWGYLWIDYMKVALSLSLFYPCLEKLNRN